MKDYEDYDALGLAELVATGEVSANTLLDEALRRLEMYNPKINAVVYQAEGIARTAIAAGLPAGPLTGVPYLLKDLYVQYQGMPTTNGSRAWQSAGTLDGAQEGAIYHSTLTKRLVASGAVIFGKTNTPELGLNASTEPAATGPTLNPWNLELSAGGSSGGAAAAVAARIAPAAHATDGGGSIRIPASNCGLFGLKPTRARNPPGPDVGEGWSGLATGHAVTRSVRDSAALLDATSGPSVGDPYCAPPPAQSFASEVNADPGRLKIALWTEGLAGEAIDPRCVEGAENAARLCEEMGHLVVPCPPPVDMHALRHAMRVIVSANVANSLSLLGANRSRAVSATEVEAVTWGFAEEGRTATGEDYAKAVFTIHTIGRRLGYFFQEYDLLLSPTLADPPLPLGTLNMMSDDHEAFYQRLLNSLPFTPLFNVSGCPAASVPLHWTDDGLPVGVQFGAAFGNEALLLRFSAKLEEARPWFHRAPPMVTGAQT